MILIKTKKMLFLIALLSVLGIHLAFAITSSELDNYRIRIHSTASTTTIKVNDGYELYIDDTKINYNINPSGEEFIFTKKDNGLIDVKTKNSIGTGEIIKLKKKDESVRYFEVKNIDGLAYAKYPDNVVVRLDSKKVNLLVINETPLETYLKGVIPYEIGAGAPLEAMKAQAITARTLAVKRVNKNNVNGFDVTNTTSDQVYKGYNDTYFSSSHNVTKAVEQTKGIVLTYNGNLIEGMYYSNNGGQTATDGFVWSSGNSTPYYKSKSDTYDTYLHKSSLSWGKIDYTLSYTKEDLRNIILNNSVKYPAYFKAPYCTPAFNGLSENYNIEVLSQINGYVTQIRLSDDEGRIYLIKNYANRWFFGLRSQQYGLKQSGGLFVKSDNNVMNMDTVFVKNADGEVKEIRKSEIKIKGVSGVSSVDSTKYVFTGRGYGHGIGMSQNGAMNRAEAGQSYKEILNFYYEGAKIVTNYGN